MNYMHNIFYFTDIHGHGELFDHIMNWCKEQDEEYTIIYGGDACDRGVSGYRIMNELLYNPHVIYLKGNHEDLFVHSAAAILKAFSNNSDYLHHITDRIEVNSVIRIMDEQSKEVRLHLRNGGEPTLIDWILDGAPESIVNAINALPFTYTYNNLDFCHAGGLPEVFERINEAEYYRTPIDLIDSQLIMWDRNNFDLGWIHNHICIHGHTPTAYLPKRIYGATRDEENMRPCSWSSNFRKRYDGARLDMDVCTIFTDQVFVLNILTMQAQEFEKMPDRHIQAQRVIDFSNLL